MINLSSFRPQPRYQGELLNFKLSLQDVKITFAKPFPQFENTLRFCINFKRGISSTVKGAKGYLAFDPLVICFLMFYHRAPCNLRFDQRQFYKVSRDDESDISCSSD